jgi:hypothetical protein
MSVIILRPAEAVKESGEPGGQEYLQSIATVKLFRHPCPPFARGQFSYPPFAKESGGDLQVVSNAGRKDEETSQGRGEAEDKGDGS